MEDKGSYLTLKEASERLGVHPNTLRNWERRGVIRLERLPGSRYRRVPVYEVQRVEAVDAACAAGRRTGFLAGRLVCADRLAH